MSQYLDSSMPYGDTGDRCLKCHGPMVWVGGQEIPFCWECTVNRELVERAQALLVRVLLKAAA